MSRFFRSASSSSSSEEDVSVGDEVEVSRDSGDTENIANGISQLSVSSQSAAPQNDNSQMLLHALLEERCMNEVIREFEEANGRQRRPEDYESLRQVAQTRYRRICTELNSLNIISPGFEQDYHSSTRQAVRNGLNVISRSAAASSALSNVPSSATRLLTDTAFDSMASPYALLSRQTTSTSSAFDELSPPSNPVMNPSRYRRDFDELGVLGKGGYGMVFHVKHKLDDVHYAIKKVPISPARIARIRNRGPAELEDLTREVRTLARLDHPNIVRYHNAWIEWSDVGRAGASSNTQETARNRQQPDSKTDAGEHVRFERSESLHRVTTQSDSLDTGIVFESSVSQRQLAQVSFSAETESSMLFSNSSLADGTLLRTSEPTLALHLQMGVYPLTLAAFISPPPSTTPIEPLTHCFHLQPTLAIMQALLNGVEYLHNEGIIHRDLKPANIFVAASPTPHASHTHAIDLSNCHPCLKSNKPNPVSLSLRIGDFGLVTEMTQPSSTAVPSAPVGTEIYRPTFPISTLSSPSAPTISIPLPSLDIFALGIIFFELLCPFSTRMERQDLITGLKRDGRFPVNFGEKMGCKEEGVLSGVEGVIRGMLAVEEIEKGGGEEEEGEKKEFVTFGEVRRRLEVVREGVWREENGL